MELHFTTHIVRVILFSVVFVYFSVNTITSKVIITKFSWHHPVVEGADKFENGCIGVHGW